MLQDIASPSRWLNDLEASQPSQRFARFAFLPELSLSQDGWLSRVETAGFSMVFSFCGSVWADWGLLYAVRWRWWSADTLSLCSSTWHDLTFAMAGSQGSSGIFQIYAVRGGEECGYRLAKTDKGRFGTWTFKRVAPQRVIRHVDFLWKSIQHRRPTIIGVSNHGQDSEQHPTML